MFQTLIHSAAFWTAFVSILGMVALKYAGIPEDLWNSLAAFLGVVIAILFGDGVAKATGLQIARSQQEYWAERDKKIK